MATVCTNEGIAQVVVRDGKDADLHACFGQVQVLDQFLLGSRVREEEGVAHSGHWAQAGGLEGCDQTFCPL